MGVPVTERHDHIKKSKIMDTMIWIILEWIISREKMQTLHYCIQYSIKNS